MNYRTVDELEHFEFKDAGIQSVYTRNGHLYMELEYVTILPENSCNRDIRKMGTNYMLFQIQHAQITSFIEEGFTVYDADGNKTDTVDDKILPVEEYAAGYEQLAEGTIYSLTQKGDSYEICMDTKECERTYTICVTGNHNVEEWDRFMNRESDY